MLLFNIAISARDEHIDMLSTSLPQKNLKQVKAQSQIALLDQTKLEGHPIYADSYQNLPMLCSISFITQALALYEKDTAGNNFLTTSFDSSCQVLPRP